MTETGVLKTTHSDGDVLYAGAVTDTDKLNGITNQVNFIGQHQCIIGTRGSNNGIGVCYHTTNTYSYYEQTNGVYQTSDAASWTSRNSNITSTEGVIKSCDADRTKAICLEASDGSYTDDSGATWNNNTSDNNFTTISDACFTTAGLAVCAGDGAGQSIYRSTDGGNNWSAASAGPTAVIRCVHMLDATHGLAVDNSGNLWKTIDGADNWVDTTYAVGSGGDSANIICTERTGDTISYIYVGVSTELYVGDSSASQTAYKAILGRDSSNENISNLVKTTNGNVYFISGSSNGPCGQLNWTTDNGTTWNMMTLPSCKMDASTTNNHSRLIETEANKLAYVSQLGNAPIVLLN